MTTLREAATQALEALELVTDLTNHDDEIYDAVTALKAALAEDALQRFTDVNQEIEAALAEPKQEPPCATRECMPSQCPNCASLEAQNTELDRKLADLEQTSLELCEVCGWRTLIPGDCCLNCERKHPLGQASTDVPLTVYVVKKAHEP